MGKEEAKHQIAELAANYQKLTPKDIRTYTEADTRRTFILPLFKALGWDVSGREEVTEEETVSRKRVDYAFRLRGIPKFFLEAKALKADLDNPEYAKQAINYAWHKGTTWAILTDFEGLKVYNAEWRESAITRSLAFELSYDQYLTRFNLLWLLSRSSCDQNLLDKWALEEFKKTKKVPIGQQLLSDFVSWRTILYKYLSKYNKLYTPELIEEAVQRILDRLIFIRTCEDREIEPPILRPIVRQAQNGTQKYFMRDLKQIWRNFDRDYDSRLFLPHLADELDCEPTPFIEVIEGLYASKDGSFEYDLNAIDADVLGGVYEQYIEHLIKRIGRSIEAISVHGKRKTQGIYYTPKFIVHYIVDNALELSLAGKPYEKANKIRILDPACGSGSFLVEAFDYLERYWKQQKWLTESDVSNRDLFDFSTRNKFLTDNLYGVDLDSQAVEIAQLNLLLKSLGQKVPLPNLVNNIREGNSLISGSDDDLKDYFGDKWLEKKPFNWEEKFKNVIDEGGFDVIIGNPPYVQMSMDKQIEQGMKDYLIEEYGSSMGRLNTFGFFIHRGITLLKPGGVLGFIVPNTLLTQEYYKELRAFILETCQIAVIATLKEMPFESAVVENVVIILRKESDIRNRDDNQVKVEILGKGENYSIKQSTFRHNFNTSFIIQTSTDLDNIKNQVDAISTQLGILTNINQAIALKHDRKKSLFKEAKDSNYKKVLDGREIERYALHWSGDYLLYDKNNIHSCKREDIFLASKKILFRRVGDRIVATLDTEQYYALNTLVVVTPKRKRVNLKFILGLMNSEFLNIYYTLFLKSTKRVFSEIQARQIQQLPLPNIDHNNPTEKLMHDSLVSLVDKMLRLQKRLMPIRNVSCNRRDDLLKQIEQTNAEIDNLVYQLFQLSADDITTIKSGI